MNDFDKTIVDVRGMDEWLAIPVDYVYVSVVLLWVVGISNTILENIVILWHFAPLYNCAGVH